MTSSATDPRVGQDDTIGGDARDVAPEVPKAIIPIDVDKAWQGRVVDEVAELRAKRDGLKRFIRNPELFGKVAPEEQALLNEQLRLQDELIMVLDDRISIHNR